MKTALAFTLCLILSTSTLAQAGFKAEYKGGTFVTKETRGRLSVSSDEITLNMKKGESLTISPKDVTGLSYGREASRRVGLWVTLGIVLTPIALFGLFAKRSNHFIGIEYKTPQGQAGAVMIRSDKHEFRALLASLRSVTGKKVEGFDNKPRKDDDWTKMSGEN